jgi:hypothetical protein
MLRVRIILVLHPGRCTELLLLNGLMRPTGASLSRQMGVMAAT